MTFEIDLLTGGKLSVLASSTFRRFHQSETKELGDFIVHKLIQEQEAGPNQEAKLSTLEILKKKLGEA